MVDEVLTELGYRWADARTRTRRTRTAVLSSASLLCLAAIALVAGSGILLGTPRSDRTLGGAIGRLGARVGTDLGTSLGTGLGGVVGADALVDGIAEAIGEERAVDSPSASPGNAVEDRGPEDPIPAILATAPWHPV